jgi:hypothetical protein
MSDKPGFFTSLGILAIATASFVAISVILSLLITFPLKILRGCSVRQALVPEPHGAFFGITALFCIIAYAQTLEPFPNEERIGILLMWAFLAGCKSIHSIYVIWSNPTLGDVEVAGFVRH